MPGYVDTAMNVAHVDDLAEGHLLALEKGAQGRSYICGGENLTMARAARDARRRDRTAASRPALPLASCRWSPGTLSQFVEGDLLGREPRVPARGGADGRNADDVRRRARATRARLHARDPRPARSTTRRRWFVENDYVRSERVARLRWRDPDGA